MDSCPATEARLISEFRRNPYARAILLVTMARFRHKTGDQEALLLEALALLRYELVIGGYRSAPAYAVDSGVPQNVFNPWQCTTPKCMEGTGGDVD